MMCLRAGVSSFYGPAILSEFAENVKMFDYTKHWVNIVLFNTEQIGEIYSSDKCKMQHEKLPIAELS